MKSSISVIILTYNEEINIENCLKSIIDWASEVIIVDSFSTDKTLEIARKYTNKIAQRTFVNQAEQFNWALDNLEIKNNWILRLDADEYLTEELKQEISNLFKNISVNQHENQRESARAVNGYYIKRRVHFMGRWIKHGGYYPSWFLRLFRKGKARYEEREMDENIILLEGRAEKLKNDFIDDNKNNLEWWIDKHNRFSSREVKEILKEKKNFQIKAGLFKGPIARKRWAKEKLYLRLPAFWRACFYFIYRYFLRFGFLDGKQGLIFHFLQGLWYRFLVDAKIFELKKHEKKQK